MTLYASWDPLTNNEWCWAYSIRAITEGFFRLEILIFKSRLYIYIEKSEDHLGRYATRPELSASLYHWSYFMPTLRLWMLQRGFCVRNPYRQKCRGSDGHSVNGYQSFLAQECPCSVEALLCKSFCDALWGLDVFLHKNSCTKGFLCKNPAV